MAKKSSQKRDLVKTRGRARYTKRTASGEFKEADDVGRSQRADRPKKAKTAVKSGYGDQGDQKRKGTKKKAAKKR
jgi:hypothetical protein